MTKKVEANPMKGKEPEYAFQMAPRCTANVARLRRCEVGTCASSTEPAVEHPKAKRMVPGSMGTTAWRLRPNVY